MRSRQETLRRNSEASYAQQMDTLRLTYDTAVQGEDTQPHTFTELIEIHPSILPS